MFVGGLIKNPWAKGDKSPLWVSGWTPDYPGETIYLRRDTGRPEDIVLVRPEDLDAGCDGNGLPVDVKSERGDERATLQSLRGIRNAVMLIRLRTEDAEKAIKRKGQESFNFGDYFAYSKICTHLGCPTSLYEQQTNRILCPCHQSQFDALQYGQADLRSRRPRTASAADHRELRGLPGRRRRLHRAARPGLLGASFMSTGTDRDRRGRAVARRLALPPRRGNAASDQQGLPDPLVVPARRDRAVQLHHPADLGCVPDAVLRPVDGRTSSTTAPTSRCAASACRGRTRPR